MGLARIGATFARLKREGRAALMPYLTLGYPDPEVSLRLAQAALEGGADILELGIPFSDPIADGPIIQRATHRALAQGVTPRQCLATFRRLREAGFEAPLLAMSYYNPILRYGLEGFARDLAQAGGDGLIVPDLLPEEADGLRQACARAGLALVFLLAPTSPPERIDLVARSSSGFIYLVSRTGVTGPREEVTEGLEGFLEQVRARTAFPLCVGFGVAGPIQARRVARLADGVIVGSAVVRLAGEGDDPIASVKDFVRGLRMAMDGETT